MEGKTKKILKIVLNVIVYVIFALVLLLTVLIVSSNGKGYTSLFGTAFVTVESDSMDGDREDSFKEGALLKLDLLSYEEKLELREGDIIAFYDNVSGHQFVNSHRIVEIRGEANGTTFVTQGDKEGAPVDGMPRRVEEVIGKVVGHTNGIGKVFQFIRTTAGFVVCIVLPCLLLLAYCVYDLVRIILEQRKTEKEKEKERIKQELLQELRADGKIPSESAGEEGGITKDDSASDDERETTSGQAD